MKSDNKFNIDFGAPIKITYHHESNDNENI